MKKFELTSREINLIAMVNRKHEEFLGKKLDEFRPSPLESLALDDPKASDLVARIRFLLEYDDKDRFLDKGHDNGPVHEALELLNMRLNEAGFGPADEPKRVVTAVRR